MAEKPRLYLETTIPSYLVARPSRDVITLARQQLTREWWDGQRQHYEIYVSQLVLDEVARGNAAYAKRRLELIETLPVLDLTPARIKDLAEQLASVLRLPAKASADAVHLAAAAYYAMDYLLTWNCAHLANAQVTRRLAQFAVDQGRIVPTVCTPEELSNEEG